MAHSGHLNHSHWNPGSWRVLRGGPPAAEQPGGQGFRVEDKDLYSGLIRLHIPHHAAEGAIFGLGIIEELGRHGYRLSAGTLYPILHSLERRGLLRSNAERDGRRFRKIYRATRKGRTVLREARVRVLELFGELFEEE